MNKDTQEHIRNKIRAGLAQLDTSNRLIFKRMYARGNLDASIKETVDAVPPEKLDWAMQQVQRSLDKKLAKNEVND